VYRQASASHRTPDQGDDEMKQTHKTTWSTEAARRETCEVWIDDTHDVHFSVYTAGSHRDATCTIDFQVVQGDVISTHCVWMTRAQLEELSQLIDVRLDREPGLTAIIRAEKSAR
tara:strand:- start:743 stop:1087 length:345 start_codon:yes stop_codon:yes gene_type:complete